jgi:hypothetical protein
MKMGLAIGLQIHYVAHCFGGAIQSRTGLTGFAIRGITALLSRPKFAKNLRKKGKHQASLSAQTGAGKESRTLDLNLGKVALYQLSYSRISPPL